MKLHWYCDRNKWKTVPNGMKFNVLRDKESHLTRELERSRTCGLELEDAHDREAVVAEQKAAKLRTKVTALEEKLLSSARVMKKVSQKAALQVELNGPVGCCHQAERGNHVPACHLTKTRKAVCSRPSLLEGGTGRVNGKGRPS